MTLPDERYRALQWARKFLYDLLDRSKTKRVPLEIRRQARSVVKHYPFEHELEKIRDKCPKILK